MVLAAEEILVVVQVAGNADLVAGGAILRRAHERFQEGLLVKLRLALDQLLVEVLEKTVGAIGKRIVDRLVNRVVGVAPGAVDVRDGMARRAGDAGLRRGVIYVIIIGIVKRAAEERHDIMATGAPARGLHVAVAFERNLPGLAHAEQVRFVVERTEMMRAVKPVVVGVLVAVQAIAVHHQRPRRDEIARGRPGERGVEIFFAFHRTDLVFSRMRRVQQHHADGQDAHRRAPAQSDPPFDARPGEPVQNVEPDAYDWRDDMRPIGDGTQAWVFEAHVLEMENINARQQQAGDQDGQRGEEEQVTDLDGAAVRAVVRIDDMKNAEDDDGQDDQQAKAEVRPEHHHVKPVLIGGVGVALEPFQEGDGAEINGIGGQDGDQGENKIQQEAQARADGAHVFLSGRSAGGLYFSVCHGMAISGRKQVVCFAAAFQEEGAHLLGKGAATDEAVVALKVGKGWRLTWN